MKKSELKMLCWL